MPADYSQPQFQDHEQFILDQLLPLIVGYARTSGAQSEVVALCSFMSLSTVLQAKGMDRATLVAAIDASRLQMHDAPEGLQ
ncbi:hypothetical protein CXK96_16860 [Stutzerimonas stutzeri]|nr:hypothetical protein CXK96_16860 [Stutzerimonas stutzeri]